MWVIERAAGRLRWRRGSDFTTCTADGWLGAIERNGSDPTSHGQLVDTYLLDNIPIVEPKVPERPDKLPGLALVTTAARELDVTHPSLACNSARIEDHVEHITRISTASDKARQYIKNASIKLYRG